VPVHKLTRLRQLITNRERTIDILISYQAIRHEYYIFTCTMAIFIVNKQDLARHPDLETKALPYVNYSQDSGENILLIVKDGCIIPMALLLMDMAILYKLDVTKS
jgi:hypothetical protein